jgi:hypothetical protein
MAIGVIPDPSLWWGAPTGDWPALAVPISPPGQSPAPPAHHLFQFAPHDLAKLEAITLNDRHA